MESMTRGGIFMFSQKYAQANNKFSKSSDPNKPISNIIYLDANNLRRYSKTQLLPFEILQWVNLEKLTLDNYCNDRSIG